MGLNLSLSMDNNDEFEKLRDTLNKEKSWPLVYMFKFIVLAKSNSKDLVESKFSDEAVISHKASSNGKYISITIKEVMLDADSIINKYKEMKGIEGLISL